MAAGSAAGNRISGDLNFRVAQQFFFLPLAVQCQWCVSFSLCTASILLNITVRTAGSERAAAGPGRQERYPRRRGGGDFVSLGPFLERFSGFWGHWRCIENPPHPARGCTASKLCCQPSPAREFTSPPSAGPKSCKNAKYGVQFQICCAFLAGSAQS